MYNVNIAIEGLRLCRRQTLKLIKLSLYFSIISFSPLSLMASEISNLPSDLGQNTEERIESLLKLSKQTRQTLNTRKIASMNAEDRFWASEFDKIMNDEQQLLFNYYTLLRYGRRLALTVQHTNRYNLFYAVA